MVWKCPSCSYKTSSHSAVMKHYYAKHYKGHAKNTPNKGKDKKIHVFKPLRRNK